MLPLVIDLSRGPGLATEVAAAVAQPGKVVVDELTVHPPGQGDF